MRRVLAGALIVGFAALGFTGPAHATCAADLCLITGCSGDVNVCPTAGSCSGGVSVCPEAKPEDCHSNVDVCLGLVPTIIICLPPNPCG